LALDDFAPHNFAELQASKMIKRKMIVVIGCDLQHGESQVGPMIAAVWSRTGRRRDLAYLWRPPELDPRRRAGGGCARAGIRKMIARLHEELAFYEGSQEVKSAR
jgi:hypothetical protein